MSMRNARHPGSRVAAGFTLIELLVVIAIIAILAAILFPVFAQAREKARQAACLSNTKQMSLGIMQYTQDYDEILPIYGDNALFRGRWYYQIYPYVKNPDVFTCPDYPEGKLDVTQLNITTASPVSGYGWNVDLSDPASAVNGVNQTGYSLASIQKPAATIAIAETGMVATNNTLLNGYTVGARNPALQPATLSSASIPIFRHNTELTAMKTVSGTNQKINLPIKGRANFSFLDGHSKSLTLDQAFEVAPLVNGVPTEDGHVCDTTAPPEKIVIPNSRYVLWNIY